MTFFNKLKWVIGILMIFVLILGTNLIDRRNFIKVKDSLTSIYDDRLAASEILFNVSDELHRIKTALILSDSVHKGSHIENRLENLDKLIQKFNQTRLVKLENDLLSHFNDIFSQLEKNLKDSNQVNSINLTDEIDVLLLDVKQLNQIQLSEGGKQLSKGERAVQTIAFFTQMEVYVLIILAIMILVVILYQPKRKKE